MPQTELQFNLVVYTHPDGESQLDASGYMNVNIPLLELFLSLNDIQYRRVSYKIYVHANQAGKGPVSWDILIPQLKTFVEQIAANASLPLKWTEQRTVTVSEYNHNMHFQFANVGDWLYIITPACVDEDLYGSDHGMYEHEIIKVPDIFQKSLTERLLTKWQIDYRPIFREAAEGFMIHVKDANLWVYDKEGGFVQAFQNEISQQFNSFNRSNTGVYPTAQATFEVLDKFIPKPH